MIKSFYKVAIVALATIFVVLNIAKATIRTVDNKYPSIGQYSNIQTALNTANNGDTIFVYGSTNSYQGFIVTKPVTIIGSGWNSDQFVKSTNINSSATISHTNTQLPTRLIGLAGFFFIEVNADNVWLERNQLFSILVDSIHSNINIIANNIQTGGGSYGINIQSRNTINIRNNIINNSAKSTGDTRKFEGTNSLGINAINSSILVTNNFINTDYAITTSSGNCPVNPNYGFNFTQCTANVEYNIVAGGFCSDATFKYNISRDNYYYVRQYGGGCCCSTWPTGNWSPFPLINGNQAGIDLNSIFISDTDFHIKSNSPASAENNGGTEVGIYGGSTPFTDKGYSNLPLITLYQFDGTGSKNTGLKVKIQAKSIK
ncbi:MAG: hypothetical protein NT007_13495 [Candidatus Kapabacteria bacterium]|nr:hypothetical protein [Candidatus Kapabacteria bacterium]